MAPAYPRKYNTMNNFYDQIISNEYFPNYGSYLMYTKQYENNNCIASKIATMATELQSTNNHHI